MKVILTEEQRNLLLSLGNCVTIDKERWLNIPFWFCQVEGEETMEMYFPEYLPEHIKKLVYDEGGEIEDDTDIQGDMEEEGED